MAFLQRKFAPKFMELHENGSEITTVAAVCSNFAQNTSLLGIQHFLRNKSFFWLLAYLVCVTMSIIQSWSVTITFFEQKTYHSVTRTSKSPMPFPSVTVCTNTILQENFNFSLIPGFNVKLHEELLEKCGDTDAMRRMKKGMGVNSDAVCRYMRDISNEERFSLGLNLTEVIQECKFQSRPCNLSRFFYNVAWLGYPRISDSNEVYKYNDPIYANCFTFNPAFNDALAKHSNPGEDLYLHLHFPGHGYWVTSHPRAGLAVLIHPPGTTPLLEASGVTDVFADEKLVFEVVLQSETISLKKRTATIPSCTDSDDDIYRRRNFHYSDQSPYRYSQEACLKSCKEKEFSKCGLIYGFTPVQSKEYERGKILAFYANGCKIKPMTMEACDCPISCREIEYRIQKDTNEVFNVPCEHKSPHSPHPPKNEYENEAKIIVEVISNIYQRIEEELSYGLFEYLGILGGNMSLWIGLCAISVLEVVELIMKIIVAALKPKCKQPNRSRLVVQRRSTD